ncbi:MAG TPA: hypothetical protein VK027_04045 [Chitinophagaceae bacterium]|nr:hypothetical protein [Chitinophagaceae bacterium]
MRKTLLLIFTMVTFTNLSQEKVEMVTGLSGSFEKEIISNKGSQVYGALGLNLGARFSQAKGDLDISVIYQFSSNVVYSYPYDSISIDWNKKKAVHFDSDGNKISSYNSILRSHFIGGKVKYLFRERIKVLRPFIEVQALTELGTNFKNGYLLQEEYIPNIEPSATYYYPSIPGGEYTVNYYYSNFYYSTPLVGGILAGIDIRLAQNLNLNIAAGYGFHIMKVKYATWKEDEDVHEKLNTIPTENIYSQMLDFQVGLSYVFPLKKTSKSE